VRKFVPKEKMMMGQLRLGIIVVALFATFLLGAGVASADFAIAGEWYSNRGPTVNIPAGQFDAPCPPNTAFNIPFVSPIPVSQRIPAPCARAQKHAFTVSIPGNGTFLVPSNAISALPQSGVPAGPLQVLGVPTVNPTAIGQSFRIPPGIFSRAGTSQVPVPANAFVQQLDTAFIFNGPATIRTPSAMATTLGPGQLPGDPNSTRRMQKNAWSKPGMGTRAAPNINFTTTSASVVTRRVTYTANANNFGGTMGMLLQGGGTVYIVFDIVTAVPGSEVGLSPVGDTLAGPITVHMGRGYNTTQMRVANPGPVFPTFNVPVVCIPNVIPPSPANCDLLTGIVNNLSGFTTMEPIGAMPGALTTNIGFPWTTGHVSAYAKGAQQGVAQTTTLTAFGNDSVSSSGVRTIQLVSGGVALRQSVELGRVPHLDAITIQVPEPGSTLMLAGALGLIGGLYSVRRRFF
jgi:hypothetical protein